MEELQEELKRLINEACQHPPGSPIRQRKLTQMIRLITPRLWKERTDYYEDALQQTWVYFTQKLCNYDPAKATVIVWLNNHLKWRLHDLKIKAHEQAARERSIDALNENPDAPKVEIADPRSIAPDDGEGAWMAAFIARLKADPQGELQSLHMRGLAQINCQMLIQRRLIQEQTWESLSQELGKSIPTLASHFQRKCIPYLRRLWNDLRN